MWTSSYSENWTGNQFKLAGAESAHSFTFREMELSEAFLGMLITFLVTVIASLAMLPASLRIPIGILGMLTASPWMLLIAPVLGSWSCASTQPPWAWTVCQFSFQNMDLFILAIWFSLQELNFLISYAFTTETWFLLTTCR